MSTNGRSAQLAGIQQLRAIAVLLVVLDHINIASGLAKYFGQSLVPPESVYAGALGVNMFFVLSGFIITYSCLSAPAAEATMGIGDYLRRRFIRIVPYLWFCVALYAGLRYMGRAEDADWMAYVRAATLSPVGTVNPTQTWTLRHEFYFYVVFAAVLSTSRARWLPLIVWASLPFAHAVFLQWTEAAADPLIEFLCSRFNILFALGVCIGLLYLRSPSYFHVSRRTGLAGLILASAFSLWTYGFIDYSHRSLASVLVAGVLGSAVLYLSVGREQREGSSRVSAVFGLLGDASYSIYLTHGIFISALAGVLASLSLDGQLWALNAILVIAAVVGGIALHLAVEQPLLQSLREFSSWRVFARAR